LPCPADSLFYVAQRKGAGKRNRSFKDKITHACASCGAAVAVGVFFCATCVGAAQSTQAGPRPPASPGTVAAAVSHHPQLTPLRYTLAELHGLPWLPADRPDDRDLPDPDGTFWPGGVFAGTAVTGTATRG
jgi:hypothetical protein